MQLARDVSQSPGIAGPSFPIPEHSKLAAMSKRDQVMKLLHESVQEYVEQSGASLDLRDDSPLIGPDSHVDSLGLVMIITGFEGKLNEAYNAELILASEKAMSRSKSPFRTLNVLADYGVELLDEAGSTP